jgi:hypothetical protein
MQSDVEQAAAERDAHWVGKSLRCCVVAGLLASIGVLPWLAYSFLAPKDAAGEMERYMWAYLFYVGGMPLLIVAGVFYITSVVYAILVGRRRLVVWWWLTASVAILVGWGIFAIRYLD